MAVSNSRASRRPNGGSVVEVLARENGWQGTPAITKSTAGSFRRCARVRTSFPYLNISSRMKSPGRVKLSAASSGMACSRARSVVPIPAQRSRIVIVRNGTAASAILHAERSAVR
eukprot:scaffold2864_cov422-Pavlova_lutheri.AAC.5